MDGVIISLQASADSNFLDHSSVLNVGQQGADSHHIGTTDGKIQI